MDHMTKFRLEMASCHIDRMVELLQDHVELEAFIFGHLISVQTELQRQLSQQD